MTAPTPYTRSYSFSSFQANNPSSPLPAQQVDAQLDAIAACEQAFVAALAMIQRSDGQLANGSVGPDQLQPAVAVGLNAVTTWAAGTTYRAYSGVWYGSALYLAKVQHVSSASFANDLGAGDWSLVVDFGPLLAAASASATAAAASDADAVTQATNAGNSAVAAAGSATSAAGSAATATTQAGAASTSAASAAASATAAAGSATAAAGSATSASNSATTATTQATAASTSATNASNSETAAAASATTATTQAGNASASATAVAGSAASASTSATTATTQATNASNSATAAAASAASAATSAGSLVLGLHGLARGTDGHMRWTSGVDPFTAGSYDTWAVLPASAVFSINASGHLEVTF